MSEYRTILKEEVSNKHFVSYEVLDLEDQKMDRKSELEKAMKLGNGDHSKVKIVFVTESGHLEVETTVWATTDETVTLKGGVIIPIHCILKVSFH